MPSSKFSASRRPYRPPPACRKPPPWFPEPLEPPTYNVLQVWAHWEDPYWDAAFWETQTFQIQRQPPAQIWQGQSSETPYSLAARLDLKTPLKNSTVWFAVYFDSLLVHEHEFKNVAIEEGPPMIFPFLSDYDPHPKAYLAIQIAE